MSGNKEYQNHFWFCFSCRYIVFFFCSFVQCTYMGRTLLACFLSNVYFSIWFSRYKPVSVPQTCSCWRVWLSSVLTQVARVTFQVLERFSNDCRIPRRTKSFAFGLTLLKNSHSDLNLEQTGDTNPAKREKALTRREKLIGKVHATDAKLAIRCNQPLT